MKEMKTSFASPERKVDEMGKLNRAVLDVVKVREVVDKQPKASGLSEVEIPKEIGKDEHAICDYVWNIELKEEAVIIDFGLVHITKGEMDSLKPGQWIHRVVSSLHNSLKDSFVRKAFGQPKVTLDQLEFVDENARPHHNGYAF
ncbi:hypothetical protein V6N12_024106 [Hibiscus sabdariffa]|uniref:Uncharacterized protein n=1 Tax=Hibiscus sabdariffa TaxID=183260 RepID=A0ABR2FZN8_9ROSI